MKLNNKLAALLILSTMSFTTVVKADQIVIPVISKPAVLQEGTQRELSVAQIAELLPWAKDSKVFLADLLESTQGLSSTDKLDRLVEGMKNVVGESAPKNSELLMRYAINRGLVLNDILTKESSAEEVGSIDAKVRVLVSSIKMAIKYYDTDMATLSKKSPAPFVTFGLDYFSFLSELNKSIFDATAQYAIQRTSLEWLQWDLYRDLNNASYAAQIVKINNSLKVYPTKVSNDKQAISFIRQMKGLSLQLNISDKVTKLTDDIESSQYVSSETQGDKIYVIKNPNVNGIKISYKSDVNGTCIALGYESGVSGSTKEISTNDMVLHFNAEKLSDVSHGEYELTTITCLNKTNSNKRLDIVTIANPVLPGRSMIPLSYDSDITTACNTQGYRTGFAGSVKEVSYTGPMVKAGAKGDLSQGLTSGYKAVSITCQDRIGDSNIIVHNIANPTLQGQPILYTSSTDGVCKLLGYKSGVSGASDAISTNDNALLINAAGKIVSSEVSYKMTNILCIK